MRVLFAMAMGLALSTTANAAPPSPAAPVAPPAPVPTSPAAAPASTDSKPVAFLRLAVKLPVGDPYVTWQSGMFCRTYRTMTFPGGLTQVPIPDAKTTFHDAFTQAGLQAEGDGDALFETAAPSQADYVVAGMAVEYRQSVCIPNAVGAAAVRQKGSVHWLVDWQLYSRLQKQVLATVRIPSDYEIDEPVSGGAQVIINKAFTESMRKLAAEPEIRAVLLGKARGTDELVKPTPQAPLALKGAVIATPRGVDAEASSVVLVRTGGGHGSGFLVSTDGYILTAAHVVGDATAVKIRWSDKAETDGVVVRVSKGRDVALIKTDPRGRAPLPIRKDAPAPGDTVFAVGAPWEQELQGSITRGVVSADRKFQGYTYVQSDVGVAPGASGGPLLDEHGRIVAITVSMRMNGLVAASTQGINLFVPIGDALSFLSLEEH